MLNQLGKHGCLGLTVRTKGDIEIDAHHTVEDTSIALGQALKEALGDKSGIQRFGDALVPLDETAGPGGGRPVGPPLRGARRARRHVPDDRHSYDTTLTRHIWESLAPRPASACTSTCSTAATPTTSSRPSSRPSPARCAAAAAVDPRSAGRSRPRRACCRRLDDKQEPTTDVSRTDPVRRARGATMTARVVVLDYGSGNLRSAERALARVGADVTVTADPDAAARLRRPGRPRRGRVRRLHGRAARHRRRQGDRPPDRAGPPVLGICVGMQVLFAAGRRARPRHRRAARVCPGTVDRLGRPGAAAHGLEHRRAPPRGLARCSPGIDRDGDPLLLRRTPTPLRAARRPRPLRRARARRSPVDRARASPSPPPSSSGTLVAPPSSTRKSPATPGSRRAPHGWLGVTCDLGCGSIHDHRAPRPPGISPFDRLLTRRRCEH